MLFLKFPFYIKRIYSKLQNTCDKAFIAYDATRHARISFDKFLHCYGTYLCRSLFLCCLTIKRQRKKLFFHEENVIKYRAFVRKNYLLCDSELEKEQMKFNEVF